MSSLRLLRVVLVAAFVAASLPAASLAGDAPESDPDCVWFPDLRCGRSDGRFDGFVKPMVMAYLFEDPFITTGIYSYFYYQTFPEGSVFKGGELYAGAVQVRVALTDRLAFIATKDGYAAIKADSGILKDESGFTDIAAGLKYALFVDEDRQWIVSPSLRLDVPVGNREVFSGNGDGVLIPALSAAWGRDRLHLTGDLGGRMPFDGGDESSSIFYNLQVDFQLTDWFSPFVVVSGMHWTGSGDGKRKIKTKIGPVDLNTAQAVKGTGRFEGWDLVNLGSKGIDGADMVTMAWGGRFQLSDHIYFGAFYERPISDRRDVFRERFVSSLGFEF